MTNGSKTATVETLTAEVRVLMVGSRQVTLSVYGQLDFADPDKIQPFGRVRPRSADYDYLYIVGKNSLGELVRASVPNDTCLIMQKALGALSVEYLTWSHAGWCLKFLGNREKCARCATSDADDNSRCEKCEDRDYGINRMWRQPEPPRYPRCGCGAGTPYCGNVPYYGTDGAVYESDLSASGTSLLTDPADAAGTSATPAECGGQSGHYAYGLCLAHWQAAP